MEIKNPEILELICETQKSIENIKETISQRKTIKKYAEEIKTLIDVMDKKMSEEEDNLEKYEERLKEIHSDEIKENIDTIKKIIESNLPKNINVTYDEDKMSLYINEFTGRSNKPKPKGVGEINIIQKSADVWQIVVDIRVNDKSRTNTFEIKEKPLRIYKAISYIHDNLSYDE